MPPSVTLTIAQGHGCIKHWKLKVFFCYKVLSSHVQIFVIMKHFGLYCFLFCGCWLREKKKFFFFFFFVSSCQPCWNFCDYDTHWFRIAFCFVAVDWGRRRGIFVSWMKFCMVGKPFRRLAEMLFYQKLFQCLMFTGHLFSKSFDLTFSWMLFKHTF